MSEAEQKRGTKGTEGRVLAGRYRLESVLGRGGMGTVWRAVDETLGRTVAVKELRFPSAVDEDEKRRLITRTLREAKAIARIRNTGAVTVYDVVDEDNRPWIVMELIEGSSLAEVIREKGRLEWRRAAEVGLAVLDVLRAAHREGILHRDVKPSNVLIAEDGRVVLTDFGIAQVEGDPSVTSTGMLVGAPSYISPERARGQKPGPPADMWSLGGLIYACVEGVPPYDKGSALTTLTAVMTEPVDPPRNAGPLTEVIHGLLTKDPAERLDDAGARALLESALGTADDPEDAPAEATRMMTLPPAPAAAPEPAVSGGKGKPEAGPGGAPAPRQKSAARAESEDRMRSALRSVRNAAAARAASPATSRSSSPGGGPAAARTTTTASLTDVVPKRTLLVIAVVVVLAVFGTVLAFAIGGDEDKSGDSGRNDKAATSSPDAGAGAGPGKDASAEPKSDDSAQPDGKGGKGGEDENEPDEQEKDEQEDETPEGYAKKTDGRFRFSMAMPEEFKRTGIAGQNSGGIYSASGGFPRVQVDFNSSPGDDAAAAWRGLQSAVRGSMSGYEPLGIKSVEYRGYPTVADWSFERDQSGERVRVLNRGFKVDAKRGYSIMITCEKDAWDEEECEMLRETAFRTFEPKD